MSEKIFALGPPGTHSHLVAVKFLNEFPSLSEENIVFCHSDTEVLSRTEKEGGLCVVAFENSLGGLVNEPIRFWLKRLSGCSIRVIAERHLRVRHNVLMRRGGNVKHVMKIISHPQAISQCFENIKRIFPDAVISEAKSTAAAARIVSDDTSGTVAAIASGFAATIYDLETVQRHVHDNQLTNVTRFHVVSHQDFSEEYVERGISGVDKTAVIFHAPNAPRSLVNALSPIGRREVNISSIHSIPLGRIGEFAFYCEFDAAQSSLEGIAILDEMRLVDENLFVLGSFPSSTHPFS